MTEQQLILGMAVACAGVGVLAPPGLVSRLWPAGLLSAALSLWVVGALSLPLGWAMSFTALAALVGILVVWAWPVEAEPVRGPYQSWEISWETTSPHAEPQAGRLVKSLR